MNSFTESLLHQNKEEGYSLLSNTVISTMRLRRLGSRHSAYSRQITNLAEIGAFLVLNQGENPETILAVMEHSLAKELQEELAIIDFKIGALFAKRKHLPFNTLLGENDMLNITLQISELEKQKACPMEDVIHIVMRDVLHKLNSDYGAALFNNRQPEEYYYRPKASTSGASPIH